MVNSENSKTVKDNELNAKKRVLFVCTHNSARSQMAEGILNHYHGSDYIGFSAGTNPTSINPFSIKVISELGFDISSNYSKGFKDLENIKFDYIITICDDAKEKCPVFIGEGARIHKSFEDPTSYDGDEEIKLTKFREIRDEIKYWIEHEFISDEMNS